MKFKIKGIYLIIDYYFVALLTVMLAVLQRQEFLMCFLFCIFHELGHLTAMLLLGERPVSVELGYFGMKINCGERIIPVASDIIISAAGPAVNIILAVFFGLFGNTVSMAANLSLAFFNLLPVRLLDGGRILSHFIGCTVLRRCGITAAVMLTAVGIAVAAVTRSNFTVLTASIYILLGAIN